MRILYTIGYQGRTIENFFQALEERSIRTLVDVRFSPASRKPGFSREPLSKMCARNGISYLTAPELGAPREIRNLSAGAGREAFSAAYRLRLGAYKNNLNLIYSWIKHTTVCLLCFERDPGQCHRSLLAESFKNLSSDELKIIHL